MDHGSVRPNSRFRGILDFAKEAIGLKPAPVLDFPFSQGDLEQYHLNAPIGAEQIVDKQTEKDLDLVAYLDDTYPAVSIFGRQLLYARLVRGTCADALPRTASRFRELLDVPEEVARLTGLLLPLRSATSEVSQTLFSPFDKPIPSQANSLWIIQIAVLTCFLLSALSLWALVGTLILFGLTVAVQVRLHREIALWETQRNTITLMLRTSGDVFDYRDDDCRERRALLRTMRRSPFSTWGAWIGEYADWFLLVNVARHYKSLKAFPLKQGLLQDTYMELAGLEADLAIVRHLQQTKGYCWAQVRTGADYALRAVVNPLLPKAAPLSVELSAGSGIFLSGKNGVGKSTLLRTIGLNLVIGRSLGFCYASSAVIGSGAVHTSIRNDDSMAGGESLYMAELRRAAELLKYSSCGTAVILIDEIFRGTNHLESVAAASAVLNRLANTAAVMVSSHNLVLAPLLKGKYRTMCISVDDHGFSLRDGLLTDPNGLALMDKYEFDPALIEQANSVGTWLGEYLAYPASTPDFFPGTHRLACASHRHNNSRDDQGRRAAAAVPRSA